MGVALISLCFFPIKKVLSYILRSEFLSLV